MEYIQDEIDRLRNIVDNLPSEECTQEMEDLLYAAERCYDHERANQIVNWVEESLEAYMEDYDDEDEHTILMFELDVGYFPVDRCQPEDFAEYLAQSNHTVDDFVLKGVRRQWIIK